jgi:UDP-N-acetylglucosamine--N-acetylmuramyl-(pentapeptide) pyrophosphoryl-undecaprenol N-acetylglucosamine transferase
LANFADKIALSFSQTRVYFKAHQNKIVLTGNPLRKELIHIDKDTALDFFGFKQDRFTILVMGGSQGSHRINAAFLKAISTLSNRHNLQIIHLTGIKDYDWLRQAYKDLDVEARLFSFLKEMHYAYSATDLAISRAGATTIAEMIFFGLPAIFIPYPYAYKHQTSNAQLLENKGVALIIEDKALDDNRLKEMIEDLINHPDKLKAMRLVCESMPKLNARDLLVEEVISLIE